jgi:hypothetical protein
VIRRSNDLVFADAVRMCPADMRIIRHDKRMRIWKMAETDGAFLADPIAEEGDPNLVPWRNRPDGPVLEWARASQLKPGDLVVQSNKYVHTVTRSEPIDGGLWALTIADPRLVKPTPGPTDAADRWMVNVTDWMPKRRELKLLPSALYRRMTSAGS